MNVTAIDTLINLLENIPPEFNQGFNMRYFVGKIGDDFVRDTHIDRQCGTTACLAGWAGQLMTMDGSGVLKKRRTESYIENYFSEDTDYWGYQAIGADILDLNREQSDQLFTPMDMDDQHYAVQDWQAVTPEQAITVLKHLRDTGEVNWHILNE